MIWYITFAIAVFCLLVSISILFAKKSISLRIGLLLVGLSTATFVVYIPIFFNKYNFLTALFCDIINVFQVISLDADYSTYYDLIFKSNGIVLAKAYFLILGILHFLMPLISLLTIYNVLKQCISSIRLSFINNKRCPLFMFSENNEQSMSIAKDVRKKNKKSDIVFSTLEEDTHGNLIDKNSKFLFYPSDISKIPIKKANRDIYYFCISKDENDNINNALKIIDQCSNLTKEQQQKNHLLLFYEGNNPDIVIDSSKKGYIDINIISRDENIAYNLLNKYPLCKYAKGNAINLLLLGFSALNQKMLLTTSWCGILQGFTTKVNVVGNNIGQKIEDFFRNYPDLKNSKIEISFYDCNSKMEIDDVLEKISQELTYCIVDFENDQESIEESINLRRKLLKSDLSNPNYSPVFVNVCSSEKAHIVEKLRTSEINEKKRISYRIIPFGYHDITDTYENYIESSINRLSKNIHMEYEDIFSEKEINVMDAIERYNLLEVNKRSNRASAMHIRYKLALLGLDYTDDESTEEVDFNDYLTEEKLELLTRAEHDRWMAFLQSEGWIGSSTEEADEYKTSGLSAGRHNCPILKMHPYICPYDDLSSVSEHLGLPDSTVYDRELITRIPNILHDKWGTAGKKYKIIKINTEG